MPPAAEDFAANVQALRTDLLRFARLQLRSEAWAEDVVSETVLAALERPQAFGGRSQLKTWLVGILKHKIVDHLRRHARECSYDAADDGDGQGWDWEADLFAADGHYREMPQDWGDPQAALRERQFMDVMEACVGQMPPNLGRVFLMREWLELDSEAICKELAVTPTNLHVMLHRARLRLRECLQARWFGGRR
ncbi:MAG: sigma-70 family RNA polymerase sigma factor [Aquabacterium sp.]|jgi:RNA polymerase sigma-70 factor (TIGR02943 family)|nr:MAG: sigma-70 family RNA polymerase sigma factor [Aquabacterium sp.]